MTDSERLLDENQRLLQQLKQREFELSILYDIANSISYSLNYDDFLKLVTDSLHKIIDYDLCSFLLVSEDEKTAKMVIRIAHAVGKGALEESKSRVISALAGFRNRPLVEQDIVSECKGETIDDEKASSSAIISSFDVPLFVQNKVVGILNVASVREIVYSDDEMKLLYTLASQASAAIERLQAVLSVEKNKMKVIVEGMAEGVAMFDENDRLVIMNTSFREMLGDNLSLAGPLDEIKKCHPKPHLQDIRLTKPFARIIHSQSKCIEDEQGRLVGTVVLLRDVSREREIEQMKSDFVSVVSHELRTPLVAMKGAVENLLDGVVGELNPAQRDCLMVSKRNIDRLGRLISDLLDISRIEAGKIQFNKQKVDMAGLINEVLNLFKEAAMKKNIRMEAVLPLCFPQLEADPDKINQVLTNLVGNSMKFTPAGGKISIKPHVAGDFLQVDVIDTGQGIPQQDLERVFDKFFQVNRSAHAQEVKGTGLGLPICRGIIAKHGGRIWAESELGKGSTFSFTLPLNS